MAVTLLVRPLAQSIHVCIYIYDKAGMGFACHWWQGLFCDKNNSSVCGLASACDGTAKISKRRTGHYTLFPKQLDVASIRVNLALHIGTIIDPHPVRAVHGTIVRHGLAWKLRLATSKR